MEWQIPGLVSETEWQFNVFSCKKDRRVVITDEVLQCQVLLLIMLIKAVL